MQASGVDEVADTATVLQSTLDDRSVLLANHVSNTVLDWLQKEVKTELAAISKKLDECLLQSQKVGIQSAGVELRGSKVPQSAVKKASFLGHEPKFQNTVVATLESPPEDAKRSSTASAGSAKSLHSRPRSPSQDSEGTHSSDLARVFTDTGSDAGKSNVRIQERGGTREQGSADAVLRRHQFEDIWHFLDDQESSAYALLYSQTMQFIVVSSVIITVVQTADPAPFDWVVFGIIEISIDCLFVLEFLTRWFFCPNKLTFIMHVYDVCDLAAAAIIIPRIIVGLNLEHEEDGPGRYFLFCFVPIIRIMKTLRRFEKLHLIIKAFDAALEALPVLLWVLWLCVLVFSAAIYIAEPRDNIESLPKAMWLTIVTMTTVGYGDVFPVSAPGILVTSGLMIVSFLYMAIPIGIVGETFGHIWQDRDRILLMQHIQKKMMMYGYTAEDIPIIFHLFDEDCGGEIELPEFRVMMREMGVGLKEGRVIELFEFLDIDGGGGIDDKEFVRQVFPEVFHKLYAVVLDDPQLNLRNSTPRPDNISDPVSYKSLHGRMSKFVEIGNSEIHLSDAARKSFAPRMMKSVRSISEQEDGSNELPVSQKMLQLPRASSCPERPCKVRPAPPAPPAEQAFQGAVPQPVGIPDRIITVENGAASGEARSQAWD